MICARRGETGKTDLSTTNKYRKNKERVNQRYDNERIDSDVNDLGNPDGRGGCKAES